MRFYDQKGKAYELDRALGKGGEATIWTVKWRRRMVAKIYHQPRADREKKLRTMIAAPPVDPARTRGHVSICWPQSLLFDQNRRVAGFLMQRIDMTRHRELFRIATPSTRQAEAPGFTWAYLVTAAENIAILTDSIHGAGYVIGDINESNFFISDSARASIVDCDSIQVTARTDVFLCTVAKAEFLAPELYRADLSTHVRSRHEDNFALAVLIFQLLMEGVHPYAGKWQAPGDPPPLAERIARGDTPYAGSPRLLPSPVAPPFQILPVHLQQLFVRAFLHGNRDPSCRPSAREWQRGLQALSTQMATCSSNARHRFSNHLARCPWCERATACGFDAYPSRCARQRAAAAPRASHPVDAKPGVRIAANGARTAGNSMRRMLLNRKALDVLVAVAPFLSAALSALLTGPGSASMIRDTAVLAAVLQCARAVQVRGFRRAAFWLAGGFLMTALSHTGLLHSGAVCATVEAVAAFLASRCLLAMLRTSIEQLRSKARSTAIAWILGTSLLLCPSIGLWVAVSSWVGNSKPFPVAIKTLTEARR
jgi:serine/threonine protein kinase